MDASGPPAPACNEAAHLERIHWQAFPVLAELMNALVLSAGGMYGAYQAGAWKIVSAMFQPDLIVGASIGAVNGWAIAGGCDPDELIGRWLSLDCAARYRWKIPRRTWAGLFDATPLHCAIQEICQSFQPKIELAVVATDLLKLQPRIFRGQQVGWPHLVATTAIIGLFDQVRIDGRVYTDGGLLSAVPLWAASELGATNALVIDVLPAAPGLAAKVVVGTFRKFSRFRATVRPTLNVVRVGPSRLLGSPLEAVYWDRRNAEEWIRAGERDARRISASIEHAFARK